MITRHFVDVGTRRVHYRRAGSGPPLLLVHQSPKSSAEYAPLLATWCQHFTCIAPDTPGFGLSDPLPLERPEVADYADAVLALMGALGLEQAGGYGTHSGAIILITAARLHPGRFAAIGANGYAAWTPAEVADFGASYTPPFEPQPHSEHLAWLWGRMTEQSWFFPWYATDPARRLSMATNDPARIHPGVMEMLESGRHYAAGYAAVLRASRDLPGPNEATVPTLICSYDGDPLQAHISRLGTLPVNWAAYPLPTKADVETACLDHLRAYPAQLAEPAGEAADAGFVHVVAGGFDGLIHWRGDPAAATVLLHEPGAALDQSPETLALDLPGHGLSDDWTTPPTDIADWAAVVTALLAGLGSGPRVLKATGFSHALAFAVAQTGGHTVQPGEPELPPPGERPEWRVRALPDLTPDRDGAYLLRAWRAVRAGVFFRPWFRTSPETAIDFDPADADPERLRVRHLDLLRARSGQALLDACLDALEGD